MAGSDDGTALSGNLTCDAKRSISPPIRYWMNPASPLIPRIRQTIRRILIPSPPTGAGGLQSARFIMDGLGAGDPQAEGCWVIECQVHHSRFIIDGLGGQATSQAAGAG
jgi:hypothetical protein